MKELSREAQSLLEAVGRFDGPSASRRQAMERELALKLGMAAAGAAVATKTAVATATAAASPSASVATVLVTPLLLGGALGVVVVVGGSVVTAHNSPVVPKPAVSSLDARGSGKSSKFVRAPSSVVEVPAPTAEPSGVRAAPPLNVRPGPSSASPNTAAPTQARSSLASELELLQRARAELNRGNAAGALTIAREHASSYPAGALREERAATEILALCALGRAEQAVIAARAFVAASPRSPLLPRLASSCVAAVSGVTTVHE